jgi:DNA-directed RNA polymerase subunit RPC12/RpoP
MCWYCGKAVTDEEPIGRSFRCTECGKDLRSCRNCRFYLAGTKGDCTEPKGEPPADKDRGNFCEWFALNPRYRTGGAADSGAAKAVAARSAFDQLFG